MQSEQTTLRLTFLGVKQHGNTFHPTSEVDIACVKTPHPSPQEKSENGVCAQAKVDIRVFLLYFFQSQPIGRVFNRYVERSILVGRTNCFYFPCCHLTANNHFYESFIQDTIVLHEALK